jgi:anti-sigma B factor antagonist
MSVTIEASLAPPLAGLVARVLTEGEVTVVAFRGEADCATLPVVVETLSGVIADGAGDIVVDLSETEFIDTAALRAVLRARETLGGGGRHLTLRSPSRIAGRLLGIFGLDHLTGPQLSTDGKEPQ